MTSDEVKTALARATRRCWPNVAKASDLPFPDYWKGVTEYLVFHAPHVGDLLMWKFIDNFALAAKHADELGLKPAIPVVPDEVREIWAKAERVEAAKAEAEKKDAWEHAAERAAAVRSRFSGTAARRSAAGIWQGRLL